MGKMKISNNKKKTNGGMPSWLLSLIVGLVALIVVGTCLASFAGSTGVIGRLSTAMKTENYTINQPMMSYFYQTAYSSFVSGTYYQTLGSYCSLNNATYGNSGLPLDQQIIGKGSYDSYLVPAEYKDKTWHEYFMDQATDTVENILIFCEVADERKLALTDEEKDEIARLHAFLAKGGYSLDELNTDRRDFASLATFDGMEAGREVCDSKVLFARIDEEKKLAEFEEERKALIAAAEAEAKANAPVEKPEGCALIGIEDFMNVELRTAKVIACEKVPKAKKLLKLKVDLGYEERQVVSGIAKYYTPDELVGKKVCLVTNLKPCKLCGVDSFGMILASGEDDVKVVFLDPSAKNGDRIH